MVCRVWRWVRRPRKPSVDKAQALTIIPDSHDPWIYFHETNLPTFQAHEKAPARISSPDENRRWPGDTGTPSPTGAKATAAGGSRGSLRAPHAGVVSMTGQPRPRFKFGRSSRLRRASEFGLVKAGAKSWAGHLLVLAVLQSGENVPARIGIITSRRVGEAVVRNRVRRQLRELFRKNQHRFCKGVWIVAVARGSSATASFADLERDWLRLIGRASILAPA